MSLWLFRWATRLLRVTACSVVAALPVLSFGADTAIQLSSLAGHSGPVSKISYSPDGRWLGFVDDAEFWADPANRVIQVRSASRLGSSDLGVNRARIERIRAALASR